MRRRQPDPAEVSREPAPLHLVNPHLEDFVAPDEQLVDPLAEADHRLHDARREWDGAHPLPSTDPSPTTRRPRPLPAEQQERYNTSHGLLTIVELRVRSLGDSCGSID